MRRLIRLGILQGPWRWFHLFLIVRQGTQVKVDQPILVRGHPNNYNTDQERMSYRAACQILRIRCHILLRAMVRDL